MGDDLVVYRTPRQFYDDTVGEEQAASAASLASAP
jgi:hypothetical protein